MSAVLEQYLQINDNCRFEGLIALLNTITSQGQDRVDWGCSPDSPERIKVYTELTAALYDSLNLEGFEVRRDIHRHIDFLESISTDVCNTFELCFYLGELMRLVDSSSTAAVLYHKARSLFPFQYALNPESQSPQSSDSSSMATVGAQSIADANSDAHASDEAAAGGVAHARDDAGTGDDRDCDASGDADGSGDAAAGGDADAAAACSAAVDALIASAQAQTSSYQENAVNGNYGNSVLPVAGDFKSWTMLQKQIFIRCHNLQRFNIVPLFSIPFLERVLCMWNSFLHYEEELYDRLSSNNFISERWQDGKTQLDHIFSEVFDDLHCEVMFCNGIIEVEFCADGHRYRIYELIIMLKRGIQGLEHRWNFTVGLSPYTPEAVDELNRIRGRRPVNWEQIRVWILRRDERSVELRLYDSSTSGSPDLPYGVQRLALFRITARLLGEVFMTFKVRHFDVIDDAQEAQELQQHSPSIGLRDLPQALRDMGIRTVAAADEALMLDEISYDAQDSCIPPDGYRSDVFAGITGYHSLLCEDATGRRISQDLMARDGVAFGCFFWPITSFLENGEVSAATHRKNLNYARQLGVFMKNLKGQEFITVIGRSTGTRYGYLEFLSWDLGRAMECAREYFVMTGPEYAGMAILNGNNKGVYLYTDENYEAAQQYEPD